MLQRIADNLSSKGGLLGSIGKLLDAGSSLLGGLLGKGSKFRKKFLNLVKVYRF